LAQERVAETARSSPPGHLRKGQCIQVTVKDIEAQLGNNGIVLYIAGNDGKHVGKLRIGQATIEWCRGKTRIGNGKKCSMQDFVEQHLEQL
jgi:hypothetical protein